MILSISENYILFFGPALKTNKRPFHNKTVLALDVYSSAFFSISILNEQADPIYHHQPKNRIA